MERPKPVVPRIPRLRAAYTLIPKQLRTNPTNLKKATLEMLRSSKGVREDAKIDLNTAGVTGLRFFSSGTGEAGGGR